MTTTLSSNGKDPGISSVTNVKIYVDVFHEAPADLEMIITSPSGAQVLLTQSRGCGRIFNDTFFFDEAPVPPACPTSRLEEIRPLGELASMRGGNLLGTWTLEVADRLINNGGIIHKWGLFVQGCLHINVSVFLPPPFSFSFSFSFFPFPFSPFPFPFSLFPSPFSLFPFPFSLSIGNVLIPVPACVFVSLFTQIDACIQEPTCYNGGTCIPFGVNSNQYTCDCLPQFGGTRCELDLDECASNLDNCSPYATCTNTIGSYQCTCNSGYRGDGTSCTGHIS